jgi:peptidoglycan/xylan/chitin deacetylase (PgdA/CDA1 family)
LRGYGRSGWGVRTGQQGARRAVKEAARFRDEVIPPRHGVVALCYHRIGELSDAAEIDLPTSMFADQMAMVADRGVQRIDDALDALRSPEPPATDKSVVTFDDGTSDFVDVALPILVQYRIPAVLYVATSFVEHQRAFPDCGKPLSWAAIEDALSTGLVTIGSHSHNHALFDRIDRTTADNELRTSIEVLFARVGVLATHFAYPKALLPSDAAIERIVRDSFSSAAIGGTHANRYGETNPYRLARSPVQRADGLRFFEQKLRGGMQLEDDVRRLANRVRYLGVHT